MSESPEPADIIPPAAQPPVSTVWPPPPTNSPPGMAVVIPPVFQSIRRLSRTVMILLGFYAALAVVGITTALLPTSLLSTATRQTEAQVLTSVQALVLIGTGICFLVWSYRLNKNLKTFGVTGLRYGPGWAVAYFFIPILSLYKPYQVFREIWQASAPSPEVRSNRAWQRIKVPALLLVWWVSFLAMNITDALAANDSGTPGFALMDDAAMFLCSLLALQVVRLLSARQEKTARLLALIP